MVHLEVDEAEAKKLRKAAKRAAAVTAAAGEEPDVDAAEAKRLRKAAKRATAEAAAAAAAEAVEDKVVPEVDIAQAKRLRKAAKRAAAEAAAAGQEQEVDDEKAKRLKKAAKRAASETASAEQEPEVDDAKAKRMRKAAKRAAAEAMAAAVEDEAEPDVDAEETKRLKKAAVAEVVEEAAGEDQSGGAEDGDFTVFIRGLPFNVEESTVRKDFLECGEIDRMNMPMNEEGRPRGLAFVTYTTAAGMKASLKYDGTDYGGRYLEVKPAWNGKDDGSKGDKGKGKAGKSKGKDKSDKGKSKSSVGSEFAVFVGGLSFSVDEEQLKSHFEQCGDVASVRMPMRDDGSPKGIAFVRFTKEEDVESSLELHETEFAGRYLLVRRATDNKGEGKGSGKDGKSKGKAGKGKKSKADDD